MQNKLKAQFIEVIIQQLKVVKHLSITKHPLPSLNDKQIAY